MVTGSEVCDDGPDNGQPGYCNATCDGYGADVCGDSMVSGSEMCDDGPDNGQPGYCNETCDDYTPYCGDWIVNGSEICDDGADNGQPFYCNATCTGPTEVCGDGVVTGSEVCDDGSNNGLAGYCNATCTEMPARTPFSDAAKAPVLQPLSFGRVLGTRDYQASFSLGELSGVGRAPGFGLSIQLTSNGAAGDCGAACQVMLAAAAADGADYVITEPGGRERRFVPDSGAWLEVAPKPGVPFRAATLALVNGDVVVSEYGDQLTRTFDASGQEIERSTPWGALVLGYDGSGRLTSATNAAGEVLSVSYDSNGRISAVTDPKGFTMTALYTADGHLVSIEGPQDDGVTPNIAIGWSQDDIVSVTRLGFNALTLVYDDGLVASVLDQDGTAYAFQSNGTDIETIDSAQQYARRVYSGEDLVSVESGSGEMLTFTRDALGRVIEVRSATGGADRVETMSYDANHNLTSLIDAEGRTQSHSYDAAGNLTSSTDHEGRTTSYSYDANDRLISTTDALGRTSTTSYDANGLPISSTAFGATTSVTYNALGLVATSTDAFNVTTTYGYDNLGRLVSQSRPNTPAISIVRTPLSDGNEQVVVTRGSDSSTTVVDRYGRVTSVVSSAGRTKSYSYDPVTGLRDAESQTFRGATQTSSRTFTNTGDVAQLWLNGQQRQAAPRIVPPGTAWFSQGQGGQGGNNAGM